MLSSQDILEEGALDTAKWFKDVETKWASNRTENNRNVSNTAYLDWQGKLTTQALDAPYLVIYTASSKDASATVVVRDALDLDFVAESKTYVFFTKSEKEAHYLSAFLNSNYPNSVIKDFQTRGLFGPRDIHKTILDVALPKFDPTNATHIAIADLGQTCHVKATDYLDNEKPDANLSAHALGRHRLTIRKLLEPELGQIDALFKSL